MYEPFKNMLGGTDPKHTPIYIKMLAGSLSGMIGSSLANPTDILKVRMQACDGIPKSLRTHAKIIYHNWGLIGFYTGVRPTVIRAMLLNSTQLSTYDHSKHHLINHGYMREGKGAHFVSSFIAGLFVAIVTSPADVIKTRVMNVDVKAPAYSGMIDCF